MAETKPVVISLGGSMLFMQDGTINTGYVKEFSSLLIDLQKSGQRIAVVVGGGASAKNYAIAARELCGNEFYADRLAIDATRLNAKLLLATLGDHAFPKVIKDIDDSFHAFREGLIPIGAGLLEGMTTDTISALFAERLGANRIVNVSNIDHVYDSDPKKNPSAKAFTEMTHAQLLALAEKSDERKAKTSFVFDVIATKIAARSSIPIAFVDGKKLAEVKKAITGAKFEGTIVER